MLAFLRLDIAYVGSEVGGGHPSPVELAKMIWSKLLAMVFAALLSSSVLSAMQTGNLSLSLSLSLLFIINIISIIIVPSSSLSSSSSSWSSPSTSALLLPLRPHLLGFRLGGGEDRRSGRRGLRVCRAMHEEAGLQEAMRRLGALPQLRAL